MYATPIPTFSLAIFGSLVAACSPASAATYKYTTITNSASPSDYVYPGGVNDSDVVVGADFTKNAGFVWRGGNGSISNKVTLFTGINNNSVAVGAAGNSKTGSDIVLYNVTDGTYQTSKLDLPGDIDGLALNLGGVVAGHVGTLKLKAFLFDNGKLLRIHPQKHDSCDAVSINDYNDVVGTCGYYKTGYLYSRGNYTILGVPNATSISVRFIGDDGVIGGGAVIGSSSVGFSYSGGIYTTYAPNLPNYGQSGDLIGELANGNFVGNYADTGGSTHGYLYNVAENEYYQLDYPGAVYTSVTALSSAGSLAGVYQTTVNGPFLAFIATCKAKKGCNP